jgi:hypothetical protein
VAELADALDLGSSSREGVQVQILSSPVVFLAFFAAAVSVRPQLLPKELPWPPVALVIGLGEPDKRFQDTWPYQTATRRVVIA